MSLISTFISLSSIISVSGGSTHGGIYVVGAEPQRSSDTYGYMAMVVSLV